MHQGNWPAWPEIDEWSVQAVSAAMLSGRLSVSGAKSTWASRNQLAADRLGTMTGRRHAVLTTNGSSAIVVALHALGIGPGHTVLLPATTWVGCATSILRVGATPVFHDASPDSPCGPVGEVADAPSAILAIHLYAQHCDIDALRARYPGVPIIEDASHSQLALMSDGRRIGCLGDVTIMSFQATKILTCGEGGALLTDDGEMAARLQSAVMDSRRFTDEPAATAAHDLVAAGNLHGANHALSETAAGLLLDQLSKFPAQARRRAEGARSFVEQLAGSGWLPRYDPGALASGAFYGMALRIPEGAGTPEDVVAAVQKKTGLILDRVYPPIPESPLYRPDTVKQYRAASGTPARPVPVSGSWHTRHVVVPHQTFLASAEAIRSLAEVLVALESTSEAAFTVTATAPTVDVVVITTGDRPTIKEALASVAAQNTRATVKVTVWVDSPETGLPDLGMTAPDQVVRIATDALPARSVERIGKLRELAIRACDADYVAFLDDDNIWETDHLSSLLAVAERGYPAVHSWRALISAEGVPATVDRFPWLPPGAAAVERLQVLSRLGVMDPGSPVVRDSSDFVHEDTRGMVDMGEWLFDRRLLRTLRLHRPRTPRETEQRVGEDDILLEQLRALHVPIACTRRPTLRYRLGGLSNPEFGQAV
ncbi:DegT/DnrJ/EryC1/StrS family aminotransferase [Streptomyces sp. NPDC000345]|uniref:DegT/DnrJ/EryC1/StrS family aminotransferase n=1 Tax=Streptomyces sp. NPDC000345 TaxID=3364537 RepID=UPI003698C2B3